MTSALLMVKRYSDDALLEAAERADQLLDEGDMAGAETWHRVLSAIERLQAKAPAEGEKVHQARPGMNQLELVGALLSCILRRVHWRPVWDADATQSPPLRMGAPHAAGRIVLLTLQATDDAAVLSLIGVIFWLVS